MKFHMWLKPPPNALIPPTAPIAINETIKPYSTAVAPLRDARREANFSRIRFIN
jgi:hypothetical protein